MNTFELQQELIKRISAINDIDFLNALKTILDRNSSEPFIELTYKQEKELLSASEEAKEGYSTPQSDMDKKVDEWLKEE